MHDSFYRRLCVLFLLSLLVFAAIWNIQLFPDCSACDCKVVCLSYTIHSISVERSPFQRRLVDAAIVSHLNADFRWEQLQSWICSGAGSTLILAGKGSR